MLLTNKNKISRKMNMENETLWRVEGLLIFVLTPNWVATGLKTVLKIYKVLLLSVFLSEEIVVNGVRTIKSVNVGVVLLYKSEGFKFMV